MTFARADLERPLPGADPALARILRAHADSIAAAPPRAPQWRDGFRQILTDELADRDLSVQSVARRMTLSQRTLQRRLEEEGTSWRAELDAVRREQAERMLQARSDRSVMADRLGYSDTRALRRALHRWVPARPDDDAGSGPRRRPPAGRGAFGPEDGVSGPSAGCGRPGETCGRREEPTMTYQWPMDPKDLFDERYPQMLTLGLPAADVDAVRAAVAEMWPDLPGGWVHEWSALASRYAAEGRHDLAGARLRVGQVPGAGRLVPSGPR